MQSHGNVEGGLSAHGGKQRVGPFFFDDQCHPFGGDRLHVGTVRHLGVGHDCGWVRVYQHHLVSLFLQGLHRLGAGIVELGTLPNDDGPGPQQQDFFEISSFRHR